MRIYPDLQARVLEAVAFQRRVGQLAAASEGAQLGVGDGPASVEVEEISGAVAQVVEVGDGQREHPARRGDAPVVPALAPAEVAGDGIVQPGSTGPADGCWRQLAVGVAEGGNPRRQGGDMAIHRARPCSVRSPGAVGSRLQPHRKLRRWAR
ncbi:hypothetical protein D3C72_1442030 [compost metagenome]